MLAYIENKDRWYLRAFYEKYCFIIATPMDPVTTRNIQLTFADVVAKLLDKALDKRHTAVNDRPKIVLSSFKK